jgi:NADH-quinone oxidoreductase subunit J
MPALTTEAILFFILAAVALATAVLMILQRNPVMSALYLIANFFCLAALYLLLRAQLLAVLQVVVYAGAIMVLVIFVIMLLNLGDEQKLTERINVRSMIGVALAFGVLLELLYLFLGSGATGLPDRLPADSAAVGTVESMGAALFGRFLLPFEITSLLLLAAIVGAVILAKKQT